MVTEFNARRSALGFSNFEVGEGGGAEVGGGGIRFLIGDGILGHQFNKRLKSFAPCSSQSLLLADFKETIILNITYKKSGKQENST